MNIATASWTPLSAAEADDPSELTVDALSAVVSVSSASRAADPNRATDIHPEGDGDPRLGLFLHGVVAAPVGQKNEQTGDAFPNWLSSVGLDPAPVGPRPPHAPGHPA